MSKIIWDKFAKDYEERVVSLTKIPQRRKQIMVEIKKGKILNLGTGPTAYLNRDLIKEGNKVVATNFSKKILEVAANLFNHKNLEYKLADSRNLPFKSNFFDSVVSVNSILPKRRKDVDTIVKEIYRTLKPAGKFIAFLPSYDTVIESMKIYGTKPRIDKREFRVYDSGQWQCFHTEEIIDRMMKAAGF